MARLLFTLTGIFAIALGLLLLIAPRVYLSLYVPQFEGNMVFAAQRLAPAIFGLGALLLWARDLPAGPLAARFAVLTSLVWFGVATTGVYHFINGVATSAILVAGLLEVALGVFFVLAARQIRHG